MADRQDEHKMSRSEAGRLGGEATAKESNTSKSNGDQKMSRSEAGRMGAEAQPTEAKRRGGEHSHDND
jgi:hypothetical protein